MTSNEDFDPPLQPAMTIDDKDDKKPDNWVDDEDVRCGYCRHGHRIASSLISCALLMSYESRTVCQMDDPNDVKPDSWDESEPMYIDDLTAEKPAEWDEEAPELIDDASAAKPEVGTAVLAGVHQAAISDTRLPAKLAWSD